MSLFEYRYLETSYSIHCGFVPDGIAGAAAVLERSERSVFWSGSAHPTHELTLAALHGYSAEVGALDGGCSGWQAQVDQRAGHSHRQSPLKILIRSQATTPGFLYSLRCSMYTTTSRICSRHDQWNCRAQPQLEPQMTS